MISEPYSGPMMPGNRVNTPRGHGAIYRIDYRAADSLAVRVVWVALDRGTLEIFRLRDVWNPAGVRS